MKIPPALALSGLLALALSGCAGTQAGTSGSGAPAERTGITIAAAASLQGAFNEIAEDFHAAHPEVEITEISYDGSSTLATQITSGAPANVFASADERNMKTVTDAALGDEPQVFATNTLVIAVPKDNPGQVQELGDLARVTTVLCAPQVPCGAASQTLLDEAGIQVQAASLEQNVSAVLLKVATGQADAGLVYRTDVIAEPEVASIVPQGSAEVINSYPITVLEERGSEALDRAQQEAAQKFVDYVLSPEGQKVLADYGFGSAADAGSVQGDH